MTGSTRKALNAYNREAHKLYSGKGFKLANAYAAYQALRAAYCAESEATRAAYAGFSDFMACHNAVPFNELRAELA